MDRQIDRLIDLEVTCTMLVTNFWFILGSLKAFFSANIIINLKKKAPLKFVLKDLVCLRMP